MVVIMVMFPRLVTTKGCPSWSLSWRCSHAYSPPRDVLTGRRHGDDPTPSHHRWLSFVLVIMVMFRRLVTTDDCPSWQSSCSHAYATLHMCSHAHRSLTCVAYNNNALIMHNLYSAKVHTFLCASTIVYPGFMDLFITMPFQLPEEHTDQLGAVDLFVSHVFTVQPDTIYCRLPMCQLGRMWTHQW